MIDKTRVLVVDDDPEFLQWFAQALRLEGMDVHTATDAAQALTAARDALPHCVLLDIFLPNIDGPRAGESAARGTRLCTGADRGNRGGPQIDSLNADMKAMNHVLRKPVDIDQLRKLLGTA